MKNKIGVGKSIAAIVLTMIIVPCLFISVFVFPIEAIALNDESYSGFTGNDVFKENMPAVIADVTTNHVILAGEQPQVLSRTDNFQSVMMKYLSTEWTKEVFDKLIRNVLDYLNFNTPDSSININIENLKKTIRANSESIAENYLLSLEICSSDQMKIVQNAATIHDLPVCKPTESATQAVESLLSSYLSDRAARLPVSLDLIGLIPQSLQLGERAFFSYSISRWVFRLLPFVTLLLLIAVAYLLKNNKKTMRAWTGWVLTGISGLILLVILVILVGLDQFISMLLNESLSVLIKGFGTVLMHIVQVITKRVLLWVTATSAVIFIFGLILLLAARFSNNQQVAKQNNNKAEEKQISKTVTPQTLEEIEQEEREDEDLDEK